MDDFIALTSRWRTALLVICSLCFVAGGIWMAGWFGPVPVSVRSGPFITIFLGWVSILFFGTCAAVLTKAWWTKPERLRINQSGVELAGWCHGPIPWAEIADVSEWRYRGDRQIILRLRDPSKFSKNGLSQLAGRASRILIGGEVAITLLGTDRNFDDAWSAIKAFRGVR